MFLALREQNPTHADLSKNKVKAGYVCVCGGGVVSTRHHNAKAGLYSGMAGSKDVGNTKSISGSLSTVLSYVVSFLAARCSYKMATLNSYLLSLVMPRRKKENLFHDRSSKSSRVQLYWNEFVLFLSPNRCGQRVRLSWLGLGHVFV